MDRKEARSSCFVLGRSRQLIEFNRKVFTSVPGGSPTDYQSMQLRVYPGMGCVKIIGVLVSRRALENTRKALKRPKEKQGAWTDSFIEYSRNSSAHYRPCQTFTTIRLLFILFRDSNRDGIISIRQISRFDCTTNEHDELQKYKDPLFKYRRFKLVTMYFSNFIFYSVCIKNENAHDSRLLQ